MVIMVGSNATLLWYFRYFEMRVEEFGDSNSLIHSREVWKMDIFVDFCSLG